MDLIHEAYLNWKSQYKLLLRTFSEEQMFQFGFQSANSVSEVMEKIIKDLQSDVEQLTAKLAKLEKPKAKKVEEPSE